ncbi:MAG: flagellin [Phycisphaerae bacterium]|nr:flagellin [Phycisphaerae bacterium]
MLAIKNNMMAANAARYLGKSYDALAQSVERLSSGLRINSAKDDAAGMAVRELMRADISVLDQGVRNTQDGISMLQTMEGTMATIDNALVRMKQLAEQASTGSYSAAQRVIMNNEFSEMAAEVDRISKSTKFNGIAMLNKTDPDTVDAAADVKIRFGTGTNDEISIARSDMTQSGLGITTGSAGFQLISGYGVSNASTEDWVSVEDSAAAGTQTITIQFADGGVLEDAISIELDTGALGAAQAYSLQEVVDLINVASQNQDNDADGVSKNYQMAEVVAGDGTNGREANQFYLQLNSRLAGADTVTMTSMLSAATGESTLGIVNDSGAVLAFDVTEDIDPDDLVTPVTEGSMGEQAGTGINLLTASAAQDAIAAVAAAIGLKDTARAAFGYKINRLESTGEVLGIQSENLSTAESRISDVDVATEMAVLTRNQVLAQAGTAMLAQANSIPQMALTLLRG